MAEMIGADPCWQAFVVDKCRGRLAEAVTRRVWHADHLAPRASANKVVDDALILQTSTIAGHVEGDQLTVRCAYVDDAAAETGSLKLPKSPKVNRRWPNVSSTPASQSAGAPVQWAMVAGDDPRAALSQSVSRALVKKADAEYISGTTPIKGLHNVIGTVGGYSIGTDLDDLIDLVARLQSDGAQPSHIIVDPLGWAAIRRIKTDTADSAQKPARRRHHRQLADAPVVACLGQPVRRALQRPDRGQECRRLSGRTRHSQRQRAHLLQHGLRRPARHLADRLEHRAPELGRQVLMT
jgi:hypothetical protein